MESQASAEGPQRRKLNLKPRDESAASKAATENKSARSNPFGAAKPRETVLAAKSGKKEEDILKEELEKDKINLRLTPEQNDERREAEQAVKEVEDELQAETDESKQDGLKAEVASRKEKLSSLIDGFQKMAIEKAKAGGGMRPSERRAQLEQQGGGPGGYGGQPNGAAPYEQRGGGRGGYEDRAPREYGNNTRARPEPAGQYGGGFDSYGSGGGGRSGGDQSFGAPRAGGGGFDSYNDRGASSGGKGRGRGSGDLQSAGSYGSGFGGADAPAAEYSSPFTGQDRF